MKKLVVISFVLILSFSLFSCSDVYEETIISDVKKYDTIWSLPERSVNETSVLFPDKIIEEQCIEFICKHTTYHVLGTDWQILLEIRYDDALFVSELDRLNNLCASSPICGYSEYFNNCVYVTAWNWNGCFEYAVVDKDKKTVCYIYLQWIEKDDLIIDEGYVPKGYEEQSSNYETYSIYSQSEQLESN